MADNYRCTRTSLAVGCPATARSIPHGAFIANLLDRVHKLVNVCLARVSVRADAEPTASAAYNDARIQQTMPHGSGISSGNVKDDNARARLRLPRAEDVRSGRLELITGIVADR
jgi:hypothetical protein